MDWSSLGLVSCTCIWEPLEFFRFGLLYLHLGTVPVLFVSFFLICHPYTSVILEQNVFILVCVLLCYVRYVFIESDIVGIGCIP